MAGSALEPRRYRKKRNRIGIGSVISLLILITAITIYVIWGGGEQAKRWLGIESVVQHTIEPDTLPDQAGEPSHENELDVPAEDETTSPEGDPSVIKEEHRRIAQEALLRMSLQEKIGQMLLIDLSAVQEENPSQSISEALEELQPGGVILFREELQTIDATVRTTSLLAHLNVPVPLWIGTDQEGGLVTRIPYASDLNGNMALAATGDPFWTEETGRRISEMLQQLGLNLNFAPVADVNVNPNNPVIGIRSFGASPETAAEYVKAYIEGVHKQGMPAVVKHFPGHGDTETDSHLGLPVLEHTIQDMEQVDWVPFQEATEADVDIVMTAHVTVPALDDQQVRSKKDGQSIYVPATLSKKMLTGVLREQIGFEGVIITDAMNMGAIQQHFGIEDASLRAVEAGVDVLLMPSQPEKVKQMLVKAVQDDTLTEKRIDESVMRILTAKAAYGMLDSAGNAVAPLSYDQQIAAAYQWEQHNDDQQFAEQVAEQAVTYIGDATQLPFLTSKVERVVIIGTDAYALKQFSTAIIDSMPQSASGTSKKLNIWTQIVQSEGDLRYVVQQLDLQSGQDAVLLLSRDAQLSQKQRNLLQSAQKQLSEAEASYGLIAVSSPYDIFMLEDMPFSIAAYGLTEANMKGAAGLLWKQEPSAGAMPIEW